MNNKTIFVTAFALGMMFLETFYLANPSMYLFGLALIFISLFVFESKKETPNE